MSSSDISSTGATTTAADTGNIPLIVGNNNNNSDVNDPAGGKPPSDDGIMDKIGGGDDDDDIIEEDEDVDEDDDDELLVGGGSTWTSTPTATKGTVADLDEAPKTFPQIVCYPGSYLCLFLFDLSLSLLLFVLFCWHLFSYILTFFLACFSPGVVDA
jgi:hypothetical protein